MSPLLNPDMLSPTGVRIAQPERVGITNDGLLAMMLGQSLCEHGFSSEQAAAHVAITLATPSSSTRMAARMEKHAAGVESMRAAERARVSELEHGGTVAPKSGIWTDLVRR